jgi:electron transport complex protein RnfG
MERSKSVVDLLKLTVILCVITAFAGLAIALTYSKTAPKIAEQKRIEQQAGLEAVFPEGTEIEEREGGGNLPEKYWVCRDSGIVAGYAFEVSHRGYSSAIKSLVGVDTNGSILGIRVLSQEETPGLGTRVAESASKDFVWTSLFRKRRQEEPWFQRQFRGLSVESPIVIKTKCAEWHVRGDDDRSALRGENAVTAITGATISTKAVVTAIESNIPRYLRIFQAQGKERNGSAGAETGNN